MLSKANADELDQEWLDTRIADIQTGLDAVLDIAANWTEGRNLARLHSMSAAQYIQENVGHLRLNSAEIGTLLTETNWSNRQIAAVAGVSHTQVARVAAGTNVPPDRGPVLGGDGKTYSPRVGIGRAPTPVEEAHADAIIAEVVAERWYRPVANALDYMREAEHWLMEADFDERDPEHVAQVREAVSEIGAIAERLKKGVG